jgi:RNA polymerase sigma-70 factor (ECF subfamily)
LLAPEVDLMPENETDREITEKLQDWSQKRGPDADAALLDVVYAELRRQAHRYLKKERIGHTLQTTALVHEAYLKLSRQKSVAWENRSHFFAIASTLMRRILIDYAKTRHRVRRGGVQEDEQLDTAFTLAVRDANFDLLELNEALERLAEKDADLAKIVELRFFCGLDVPETAEAMGVSDSTVKRGWAMAKAWLHRELTR